MQLRFVSRAVATKKDHRDAELILDLLLKDEFPRIHRLSAGSREVLRQLRYRHRLVIRNVVYVGMGGHAVRTLKASRREYIWRLHASFASLPHRTSLGLQRTIEGITLSKRYPQNITIYGSLVKEYLCS